MQTVALHEPDCQNDQNFQSNDSHESSGLHRRSRYLEKSRCNNVIQDFQADFQADFVKIGEFGVWVY